MVTISTTPDLASPQAHDVHPMPDPGADPSEDDWLVGDEDVRAAPATSVPTLIVSPPTAPSRPIRPSGPAPRVVVADPVGSLHKHHRGPSIERVVAWSSALVGAGGILLGLALALLNVEKWPASGVCTTYQVAHHGHGAFGCGGTRSVATVLPPLITAVLVIGVLAVVWIPHHTARRRLELIAGLAALLVATALVEALVYAALP